MQEQKEISMNANAEVKNDAMPGNPLTEADPNLLIVENNVDQV